MSKTGRGATVPVLYSPECVELVFSEVKGRLLVLVDPFDLTSDTYCQCRHLLGGYLENALAPAGPVALLLLVGHAGRQGHHVLVDVGVALF